MSRDGSTAIGTIDYKVVSDSLTAATTSTLQNGAGTDLTAYRIISEALTNVAKHAAASQAQVRLCYTGDWLGITITHDGNDPPPSEDAAAAGPGYGLEFRPPAALRGWLTCADTVGRDAAQTDFGTCLA